MRPTAAFLSVPSKDGIVLGGKSARGFNENTMRVCTRHNEHMGALHTSAEQEGASHSLAPAVLQEELHESPHLDQSPRALRSARKSKLSVPSPTPIKRGLS